MAEKYLRGQMAGQHEDLPQPVQEYVEHVLDTLEALGSKESEATLRVEDEIRCYYDRSRRGFIDAAVYNPHGGPVHLIDLKYGKGVSVQAKENHQLAIYARSWVETALQEGTYQVRDEDLLVLTIFQPRIYDEEAVRQWSVTWGELKEWTDEHISEIAFDILEAPEDQMFNPSEDTCRFCPAKGFCQARADVALEDFENLEIVDGKTQRIKEVASKLKDGDQPLTTAPDLPDPERLSDEQIALVVRHGKALSKWLSDVADHACKAVYDGTMDLEGWKVVKGRKHRRWASEAGAEEFLKKRLQWKADEVYDRKLTSPAKAEKLWEKKKKSKKRISRKVEEGFYALMETPEGAPTLVPEDDKRQAIKAGDEFENLEQTKDGDQQVQNNLEEDDLL